MANKWYVSRQSYSSMGENALVVEIAGGGRDYSNPGQLVSKYSGEADEYTDPREAVTVAVDIASQWRKDLRQAGEHRKITIRRGHTGGFTMPFEPTTIKEATDWAEATYTEMPKCPQCGGLMGDESWKPFDVDEDEACCSENCANLRFQQEEEIEV